jgi:hypothetical protein
VEGAIAGTRDTLLPLKLSSGPQPGGRLFLQGFGTGETPNAALHTPLVLWVIRDISGTLAGRAFMPEFPISSYTAATDACARARRG